jgi:WD40 repeat protein
MIETPATFDSQQGEPMMFRHQVFAACLIFSATALAAAGQTPTPAKDLNGDPLPPFATARLGTVRWRHDDVVRFAAFLPDGKRVISVADDQTIRVWEFPSGKELRRVSVAAPQLSETLVESPTYSFPAGYAAALSKDGKIIATYFPTRVFTSTKDEPPIRLHDVETGKELPPLRPDALETVSLAFSPTGEHLVSTDIDGTLRIWDWATGKELRKVSTRGMVDSGALRTISSAGQDNRVYSPDGNTLMFLGRTNVLRFLDLVTGKEIGPPGHVTAVQSVQFLADGKQIVTTVADGTAHKWVSGTGKDLGLVGKQSTTPAMALNRNVTVSSDGSTIATLTNPLRSATIALTDSTTGNELSSIVLDGKYSTAPAVMFSPRNKMLAVYHPIMRTAEDQKIDLYHVVSGKRLHTFAVAKNAATTDIKGKSLQIRTLIFSPDGHTLAWSVDGKTLFLGDTAANKPLASLPMPEGPAARDIAFTPDNRCLAFEMEDGTVVLYEVAAAATRRVFGQPLGTKVSFGPLKVTSGLFPAATQRHLGSRIALSPDGKSLALACLDQVIRVWDIATSTELAAFKGHAGNVYAIAFSPDGALLASGSGDTTALVWDLSKVNRPAAAAKSLRPEELEQCWQALAANDGNKAFVAICDLTAAPKQALAFIQQKLKPAAPADPKRIEELIAALDDTQYKVRTTATAELYGVGEPAVPALEKALTGNLTLETKSRLEEIRNRLTGKVLQGDRLRLYRAVEVLERTGTPEARQVLQGLAAGAPRALLTTSAQAALKR